MPTIGDHLIHQFVGEWTIIHEKTMAMSAMFYSASALDQIALRASLHGHLVALKQRVDQQMAQIQPFARYENDESPELERLISETLQALTVMLPPPPGLQFTAGRGQMERVPEDGKGSKSKGSLAKVVQNICEQYHTVQEVPMHGNNGLNYQQAQDIEVDPITGIMVLTAGVLEMFARWLGMRNNSR